MSTELSLSRPSTDIVYPESDGLPMADNTAQFNLIVMIKVGLDWLFDSHPDVFVAGNLYWYPVEGNNKLRQAPDVLVVFGRPKGFRSSYLQWREGGIAPQVVFEILSPGNSQMEMTRKFQFYELYGVEEYYLYDPADHSLDGYQREGSLLVPIDGMVGWVSPRLGIRFAIEEDGLRLYYPDGKPFEEYSDVARTRDEERQRADKLAAQLRALGIEPEA
jgi:Uma2 family endonuclease